MSAAVVAKDTTAPFTIAFRPIVPMDDEQFFAFCQINRDVMMERTAEGEVVIMAPVGGESGSRNIKIASYLLAWAERDGAGVAFDSSTGFILPDDAVRAPDASWVLRSRLAVLTPEQKQKFLPLCPDFVIELRSPSDRLPVVQHKMRAYQHNGARLGWLIDPQERRVHVYASGESLPVILENPESVSGDPVLPGFILDMSRVWNPAF